MTKKFKVLFFLIVTFIAIDMKGSTVQNTQIKVAMAQIVCIDGDLSGNLIRIENAIKEAKSKHADIILFPESCLLGWINPVSFERATAIPGKQSDIICDLANKYKIYICLGLDEKENDKLYDAAILIDNSGKIILKHRKINVLPELMTPAYSIGEGIKVVNTKFGKIGVLICADSFLEDVLENMKAKKPDILLIPYGWAAPENSWPDHGKELIKVVQHAAEKMDCPVIGTNLIGQISNGPWKGQVYGGQSVAFIPHDNNLVLGKDRERDVVIITIIN